MVAVVIGPLVDLLAGGDPAETRAHASPPELGRPERGQPGEGLTGPL